MVEVRAPGPLGIDFASRLRSTKADFVSGHGSSSFIAQHGAASVDADGWPGWPKGLTSAEPVIETYVADEAGVAATSDNDPFVSAWRPLVEWMNTSIRSALEGIGVELAGDAYVTASLTATAALEGTAHMDDDTFEPAVTVNVVAIIGELAGPRVATTAMEHAVLRPMSQIVFTSRQLDDFANGRLDHCRCEADQLVLFQSTLSRRWNTNRKIALFGDPRKIGIEPGQHHMKNTASILCANRAKIRNQLSVKNPINSFTVERF